MSTESFDQVVEIIKHPNTLERYQDSFFDFLMRFGLALIVLIVGIILVNFFVKLVVSRLKKRKADETFTSFMQTILLFILRILVIGFALGVLGIKDVTIAAAIGSLGLAVGLGLQGSLQNFASGLLIVFFRPFKLGDWIDVDGVGGTVVDIGILYTTMRTANNLKTVVPNSLITTNALINSSAYPTRRADLTFVLGYDDDLKRAKEILLTLVTSKKGVLKEPSPQFHISSFDERGITCVLKVWARSEDYWDVYWELLEEGKEALEKEGIDMPHPKLLLMEKEDGETPFN